MIYAGSCHCGAVRFEVEAPAELDVDVCNCSICRRGAFLHLIRPRNAFRLLSGEESLNSYTFNTGVAQHSFCRRCGVKPFYVPRSNPDGIDVNARCLITEPAAMRLTPFDGVNWEANAHRVAHKSHETESRHE